MIAIFLGSSKYPSKLEACYNKGRSDYEEITSTKNNQLKNGKITRSTEKNQYIIEGFHLVEEAVKANADVSGFCLTKEVNKNGNLVS